MFEKLDWRHVLAGISILIALFIIGTIIPALYVELNPNIGRAAVVKLDGPISQDSGVQASGISPDNIATLTQRAKDGGADVIIYEVNSPGGSVVASKEAARVVKEAGVPTVCRMKEIAASGGYWISSACDHIVADSLSLTGSIGVTSTYLEFSDLLDEYGVEYVNLTSGEYKDMGSRYKDMSPEEREKFQHILDGVHEEFIQEIADNRNLSTEQVREVATGEVFLGVDAKQYGLVDTLGGKEAAKNIAKDMIGVSELKTNEYEPPRRVDLFSLLFTRVGEGMIQELKSDRPSGGIQARYD